MYDSTENKDTYRKSISPKAICDKGKDQLLF